MSNHTHKHMHNLRDPDQKRVLPFIVFLAAGFMVVEVVAGIYTGSLALLSDAAHMLIDVFALSLALFALRFSEKSPTSGKTFGFYRLEILAALINSLLLYAISIWIFIEAYERINTPHEVKSLEMTLVAVLGLLVNLLGIFLLSKYQSGNLNIRGAFFHIVSDALGSVGAIAAGLIMLNTGWYYADSIISVLIGLLIIRGAWTLFSESVHILLEGTPKRLDLGAVENYICSHRGVLGVHDLHAWTLTQGYEALSAHLVVEDISKSGSLISDIEDSLREKFKINHVTLQIETEKCEAVGLHCYETETT